MERFIREQEAIIGRLRHERESIRTGRIHHYARDEAGLSGISGGRLWMSDYTTLNDAVEIKHGVDIGLNVLKQACDALPLTERLQVFKMAINKKVERGLSHYFAAYVLSLSLDGNNPNLWDRYANQGRGFCVEFESTILDDAFKVFTKANGFEASGSYEVIYDDVRLRSIMQEYVSNALAEVVAIFDPPHMRDSAEIALNSIASSLLFAFIFTALYFKDTSKDWQHEHEYRFLIMTLPDKTVPGIFFRGPPDAPIGYYKFDWTSHRNALTSVSVGPAQPFDAGRVLVERALTANGLTAEVRPALIPPTA